MQTKKNRNTNPAFTVCIITVIVIFAIFTARLADWQLIHGKEYKDIATRSTSYTVETDATRGEILDRNGEGLVVNTTHYKITIDKLYADKNTLNSTFLSLINILEKTGDKWEDTLPISYKDGNYSYISDGEKEISNLIEKENLSPKQAFDELVKRYELKADRYSDAQLKNLVSVYYNMELCEYSNSNPYIFAKDISRKTVNAVSENTQGISGVDVQTYLVRGAEDADIAPHILGALGSISEEEYKKLKDDYKLSDSIGKFGIELAFEEQLRGIGGAKIIERNSDGTIVDTIQTIDSKPGNTVYLTLDKKLQQKAVKSLAENVKAAREEGKTYQKLYGSKGNGEDCEAGAVVMLSVKDFSVLASASYPTYDLNKYSEYGDYYLKLSQDKNSPMYNRAFVGSFACGSVFKPCVALAGLEEKVIKEDTEIYCKKRYDYYPTNVVHCMHYHGDENVRGAITQSCNSFFAETGRLLGIETMYLYAEKFSFGEYTGVEIEESKGFLAGRDSTTWQGGNTVQAAIGQSDNAFTPLQLATYVATIANDGVRLKTHVVSKITDYEREKVLQDLSAPIKSDECSVSQKNLDVVQSAMLNVTQDENGTAYYMFGDYKVKVAAKTGTAENSGSDHTTFICYAPYDNPEVAISVVLEHGKRGQYSMQVAKDLLDEYFKNKAQ